GARTSAGSPARRDNTRSPRSPSAHSQALPHRRDCRARRDELLDREPVLVVEVGLTARAAGLELAYAAADDAARQAMLRRHLAHERAEAAVEVVRLDRDGGVETLERLGEILGRRRTD